jgi:5-methylcytosine-specific restriction enzyme subunit McrC
LRTHKTTTVFEHQCLYVGQHSFKQTHLDAPLKLNEYRDGKYFEPVAKGITFNQFEGVIKVDGITIEMHPKADKEDEDNNWKGVLIKILKACGTLKVASLNAASFLG